MIRNFFLLKLSLRTLAQENVLILVLVWNTRTPRCATARVRDTPSWSCNNHTLDYNSGTQLNVDIKF